MKHTVPFIHQLNKKEAQAWLIALRSAMPKVNISLLEDISKAQRNSIEIAIIANPNPDDLQTLPKLKWVQSLWAGIEQLLDGSIDKQIFIVRLTDPQLSNTMSEAVLAWTLYLHRDMPLYAKQQSQKIWKQHSLSQPHKKTIGILGMGQLGQQAAKKLLENGFNVIGWNRNKQLENFKTFKGKSGLFKVAELSDILVVLLPLTAQTKGLLEYEFFSHLKHGASLINFARASIINTQSLIENLECGKIKHAVLDVFEKEPLPKSDPLWSNPSVTILPHISAPTDKYTASHIVAKNIKEYFYSAKIPETVSRQIGY